MRAIVPCEHGFIEECRAWRSAGKPKCSGGRPLRVDDLDIEAVAAEMRNRRIDRYIEDPDIWDEAVRAIAAAAIGGTE